MAFLWYSGTAARARLSAGVGQYLCRQPIHQHCPACVRETPLGLPVEPEVYGKKSTASSPSGGGAKSARLSASASSYPSQPSPAPSRRSLTSSPRESTMSATCGLAAGSTAAPAEPESPIT